MSPKKPTPPGESGRSAEPGASGDRSLPPRLDPRVGRSGSSRAPRPAAPAGHAPADAAGPARRGRTRRTTIVVRALAGLLSAVLLSTTGWSWYLGQVAEASVNRTDAIPDTGNEGTGEATEAMNLLLVGSDSRADLTDEQLRELNAGEDSGLNTDTIILVHVPADGSAASFVSFPRDSYVKIPGYGWDKLNAAYAYGYNGVDDSMPEPERQAGGAQLLVQTISELTGLQIDHYAEVDLLGFFQLSSVVGGVEVNLCAAVDDRAYSGAVFAAGPQTISGADALRFVRQRHGLPRGDYDRIIRQQVFIAGVLRKMLSEDVLLDLGKQRQLVEAASQALTVDEDLDLFGLARQMQSVTEGSIEFQTVPYVGDERDEQGRSIIRLEDEETLHAFFAQLSAEPAAPAEEPAAPPATVDPASVPVEVLNGSGTPGLAADAAGELEEAGFPVAGTGNADSADYTQTVVRHAAGDEALAATVAAAVPGVLVELDDTLTAGTVQLVLGEDFTGIGVPVTAATPADEVAGEDLRTAQDTTCIN
ncbi:LCP family protein [Trujillonella endophytica]|uniref:Transcriptional attenuator, LytR family n=1 Tax=Trujillonella endophytica TaxID=673521 RepID=A0A1H8RW59_9ACTN|nr:LCP family protein [Trujillella endophytica]SEO70681.1 transcriptional attenuator, LytR family [Trujillella endophytica]